MSSFLDKGNEGLKECWCMKGNECNECKHPYNTHRHTQYKMNIKQKNAVITKYTISEKIKETEDPKEMQKIKKAIQQQKDVLSKELLIEEEKILRLEEQIQYSSEKILYFAKKIEKLSMAPAIRTGYEEIANLQIKHIEGSALEEEEKECFKKELNKEVEFNKVLCNKMKESELDSNKANNFEIEFNNKIREFEEHDKELIDFYKEKSSRFDEEDR